MMGDRSRPLAVRLEAGEQQQRLGVAAHAGGEVVEGEQLLELVGIGSPGAPSR